MSDNLNDGEIILDSGQKATMLDGIVRVVPEPKPLPDHYFCMSVASHQDFDTPVLQACSDTYHSLTEFYKQLEALDYLLINIERVPGIRPGIRPAIHSGIPTSKEE